MRAMIRTLALPILAAAFTPGCCTMFMGTNQEITIESDRPATVWMAPAGVSITTPPPRGSSIWKQGKEYPTPAKITIKKLSLNDFRMSKVFVVGEGDRCQPVLLEFKGISPLIYLNILNLGIGMLIDGQTGAGQEWADRYYVQLATEPARPGTTGGGTNPLLEEWKKRTGGGG